MKSVVMPLCYESAFVQIRCLDRASELPAKDHKEKKKIANNSKKGPVTNADHVNPSFSFVFR